MRNVIKTTVISSILILLTINLFAADKDNTQKLKNFWKWYQQFPWMQEFYPVGLYGDGTWTATRCSNMRQRIDMTTEVFSKYYINTNWSTHLRFNVSKPNKTGHTFCWPDPWKPQLNDLGKWYYGEVLPCYELHSLPGLASWLGKGNGLIWKRYPKMYRDYPALTEKEKDTMAKDLKDVFAFCRFLKQTYPYVAGFITDDEPHYFAPATAANNLVEKYVKTPAMTCSPTFAGLMKICVDMPAFTGDWYFHLGDGNSWLMASRLRKFNQTYPGKIFWFMAWCCASGREGNEPTLPGLRDSRITEAKLRLEVWQATALGCKGLFAFLPGGGTPGYRGGAGLIDSLMQPTRTDDCMLEEYGRLGRILSTVGPLLLSCYPEATSPIKIKCGKYKNIFFDGPALDHGILRDVKSSRWYIVPWNNNPDARSGGRLVLPKSELKGKKVYNMLHLKEVSVNKNELPVNLIPGGGTIFMVATPEQFEKSKQDVLRMRCWQPRVRVRPAYALAKKWNLDLAPVDQLLEQAKKAEKASDWVTAKKCYKQALAAIDKQGRRLTWARRELDKTAKVLSKTEDMMRCNIRLLELPAHVNHAPTMFKSKYAGKEVRNWEAIVRFYYDIWHNLRNRAWGGDPYLYVATAQSCYELAVKNQEALQKAIARRRQETRRPIKVALITPDRIQIEYYETYAWFFDYCDVRWFAPGKNGLVDRKNKSLDLKEFDVVWIHQNQGTNAYAGNEPEKSLMPVIMKPDFIKNIKSFVESGKGLLLTGIAGLYTIPLGVEKQVPDLFASLRPLRGDMGVGVMPAPGFTGHPVFADFKDRGLPVKDGFFTNGGGLCCELAWKKSKPSGAVVASLKDFTYGLISEHAIIVEYKLGAGKIVVMDGQTIDFTPARGYAITIKKTDDKKWSPDPIKNRSTFGFRTRTRGLALNALSYLSNKNTFIPDRKAQIAEEKARKQAEKERRNTVWLPNDQWKFKLDPENIGEKNKWYAEKFDDKNWKSISVGKAWEAQGYDYDGYAWYRRSVPMANRSDKKTLLHFGAVDEKASIWIDGKKVGDADKGWDQPFSFDITEFLSDKDASHQITVRVHDHMAAGGIWKPICLKYK